MPKPKHSSISVVLVLVMGFFLGSVVSKTFSPLIEFAFSSYHVFALSSIPNAQFSDLQKVFFFSVIDIALVLGVIIPLLLFLQKKTNLQLT